MIPRTAWAASQIAALLSYYYEHDRPEAASRLLDAVNQALSLIEQDPLSGTTHPRPYPEIANRGFLWIKVHRYWFAYSLIGRVAVLTNVLFDAADLPSRVKEVDRVLPTDEDDLTAG